MRALAFLACLVVASSASAQLPTWDNVVASAKMAWKKTIDAGRPLAQQIARETPERFRIAKNQALSLVRQAEKFANSTDLQHKKEIAAELWRVRGSLDLMALLDPQTLKMFGIDVPDLTKLRQSVNRQLARLRV
jgi:hypothetical protein